MAFQDLFESTNSAKREAGVLRRITRIVAIACAIFALAVPIVYYVLLHVHVKSDLRVEAVARARGQTG